jgi:hypothetical protein
MKGVVGERGQRREAGARSPGGLLSGENAGISSEKRGENPLRRKPKVS